MTATKIPARFIGLLPSLELKDEWKPDESGSQFGLSDSPAVNGWAREKSLFGLLNHADSP